MSVGLPLAGPDPFMDQQHPLKIFVPHDAAQESIAKTLVGQVCDVIGPSAVGDAYFTDKAHDSLLALLERPRGMHSLAIQKEATMFLNRVADLIGLIERMHPGSHVLQELYAIHQRCLKTFPEAFAEPSSIADI